MDRKEFCRLVQLVSMYPNKSQIPSNLLVKCENIAYLPCKYQLSFEKGQPIHEVVLKDLKANSCYVNANLERIERND